VTARAVLVVALLVGGRAAADPAPPAATLVVDFAAPPSGPRWFVAGLEETVARQLSRFQAVRLGEKLDARRCPGRATRCLVDGYRDAGVQVVVLGALRGRALDYEVYATWASGRAFNGSLRVAGVASATLQRHIGEIVRPIVHRGGLVDQRPPATPTQAAAAPAPIAPPPPRAAATHALFVPIVVVGLMLFLAFPALLLVGLVGARELRKRGRPASWKWSAALIGGLALALAATSVVDMRALFAAAAHADLALAIAAGVLWGAFVLINVSWLFSPIHGLGDARYDALWPLLQSWLALALLRAWLLLFYAPFLLLTLYFCQALDLPARVTLALALPAVGLLVYVWLLTLVDNLALFVDAQLVVGLPSTRNPWHATIKRYFRGYVRRTGVELDGNLFERTLFLPSLLPTVLSYGGGFARPRVLVGESPREAALGQLPDETELPEHTVNAEELPFGFLVPMRTSTAAAWTESSPRTKTAEQRRRELSLAPARPRGQAPRLLGEAATTLGWVMPQPADSGIPLISNTQEDYEVVKRLLTEHYAKFERNLDDDEVDDTDPTQKDFLFGALLREMGTLASRDILMSTIRLSLALAEPKASRPLRWLIRAPIGLYDRFLSGPAARVGDAYAALNQGLHHLIQYLCFLRGDAAWLTARANAPTLVQTSKELLERMDRAAIPSVDRHLLRATPRNRLLWLSQFFHAPLGSRRDRRLSVVAALLLALLGGAAIFSAVRDAIDYHPIYVERRSSGK
jgi:hypothetical protein